jgi:TrmH family RNA methyltransferase
MLSKNEIKDIQSLRHKKSREETGLFVAEGPKIVGELLMVAAHQAKKVYCLKEWLDENRNLLSNSDFEIISESQQPIIPNGIILYLDTIQDPGNLGSIIRIADWFGIKNIVCTEGCADLYNIKVVQATMASIVRVNIFYDEELRWLQKQDVRKYAAALDGESIYTLPKTTNGIIIIGNESKGIQPSIMEMIDQKITIPKIGAAESLNAAVATGIILSHLMK